MTSAENPEGIASHPLTAALPALHLSFNLFSAMPFPRGMVQSRCAVAQGGAEQLSKMLPKATTVAQAGGNEGPNLGSKQGESRRRKRSSAALVSMLMLSPAGSAPTAARTLRMIFRAVSSLGKSAVRAC